MVDGDVDSAEAVTHTRISVSQNDGKVLIKQVLEKLDSPPQNPRTDIRRLDDHPGMDNPIVEHMQNMSPPPPGPARKKRVSIHSSHINERC